MNEHMQYDENDGLQIVFSLAQAGKYDEARTVLEQLDIPAHKKEYHKRRLWVMESAVTVVPDERPGIPLTPVISMILGFVLICAGFFFDEPKRTYLILFGIFLASAIPYIFVKKEQHELAEAERQKALEAEIAALRRAHREAAQQAAAQEAEHSVTASSEPSDTVRAFMDE